MNALPARIAGVERLVMTVPAPGGELNPLVLVAAHQAGVDEIYRVGGAQAIGALAFGTATIAAVDKIVGPGNAYVAEAKRQVFGRVGIDLIAGPSEIVVVADGAQDPAWIAADLLSQAEHDALAQAILITDAPASPMRSPRRSRHSSRRCRARPSRAPAGATSARSWWCRIWTTRPRWSIAWRPSTSSCWSREPQALAERIRNAGALFLGPHTPEVIGDYVGGPNHVLPTDRTARFASGLSVYDFLKRTTLLSCTAASLAALGPPAAALGAGRGPGRPRARHHHAPWRRRPGMSGPDGARISDIRLDAASIVRWNREIEHERQVAVFDLLERNSFELVGGFAGPYRVALSLREANLVFTVDDEAGAESCQVTLSMRPFRRLIKDYFLICDSYFQAIRSATPSRIEAIDMGRRGLHNEGAEKLADVLADRIKVDGETARRLFTLVCVLHIRS